MPQNSFLTFDANADVTCKQVSSSVVSEGMMQIKLVSEICLKINQAILATFYIFRGKSDKAQLAATSSGITENLMSISRMMASQVQRSEDTISTLGVYFPNVANLC